MGIAQYLKGITHILSAVRATNVGDDQAYIRIAALDLDYLRQVDRIAETRLAWEVQHHDPAVLVGRF